MNHGNRLKVQFLYILFGCVVLVFIFQDVQSISVRNFFLVFFVRSISSPVEAMKPSNIVRAQNLFYFLDEKDKERFRSYQTRLGGLSLSVADIKGHIRLRELLAQAQAAKANMDWETAKKFYGKIIQEGDEQSRLEASVLLADLFFSRGDQVQAKASMDSAFNIISAHTPSIVASCSTLNLIKWYVDQHDLALGHPVHILLVWNQANDEANNEVVDNSNITDFGEWRMLVVDDLVFQVGITDNLILDGGFEHAVPHKGLLTQFPAGLFTRQKPEMVGLQYETHRGQNMMLALNGHDVTSVGIRSKPFEIVKSNHNIGYLVTGRYRTVGRADPRIGIRWQLKDAVFWDDNISSYAVQQPASEWTFFASLLTAPPEAKSLEYWILNIDASSTLFVDDLGLFLVPLPCSTKTD